MLLCLWHLWRFWRTTQPTVRKNDCWDVCTSDPALQLWELVPHQLPACKTGGLLGRNWEKNPWLPLWQGSAVRSWFNKLAFGCHKDLDEETNVPGSNQGELSNQFLSSLTSENNPLQLLEGCSFLEGHLDLEGKSRMAQNVHQSDRVCLTASWQVFSSGRMQGPLVRILLWWLIPPVAG